MKKLLAFALAALPALAAANPVGPGPLAADPDLQHLRQRSPRPSSTTCST